MSHITKLKTAITKQFILKETLKNLGLPWTTFDIEIDENIDLKKNPRLEFAILQSNGSNITFLWTGEVYEIGIDISKWQQSRSIAGFMSTIEQKYAWTLLNLSAETSGFNPENKQDQSVGNNLLADNLLEVENSSKVLVCTGWK